MTDSDKPWPRAIACNYAVPTSYCSRGAKAYFRWTMDSSRSHGGRITILARSRSGRWIDRWERIDRLTNFRMVAAPQWWPWPDYSAEQKTLDAILRMAKCK